MSSSKQPETLQEFLDAWYRAYVISSDKNPIGLVEAFKTKASEDATLLSAAREKLNSLKGIPDDRCFVSKIQRMFLNQALN